VPGALGGAGDVARNLALVAEFCCSTEAATAEVFSLILWLNPVRREYDWRCLRSPWRFVPPEI
ncbi:MAG: hypothetical protein WBX78_10185, partial [Pseudolabrys sp.]